MTGSSRQIAQSSFKRQSSVQEAVFGERLDSLGRGRLNLLGRTKTRSQKQVPFRTLGFFKRLSSFRRLASLLSLPLSKSLDLLRG